MSASGDFVWDVFVSYGWAGIQHAEDADRGWVAEFKRRLEGELSGELGRLGRVFLDVEQSKSGELPENLSDALQSSKIFLSIVSPGSCRLDSWCHFELRTFIESSVIPRKGLKQVFVARIRDVPPPQWPEPIRQIIAYDFLSEDSPRRMLPQDHLARTDRTAGALVQRLALEIAQAIRDLEQQITRTVFLAFTDPALEQQVARLATEIDVRGGSVIRESYVPGESESSFVSRAAINLRRSGLSVHLIGADPDQPPAGWSDSVSGLEIRAANERFGAGQKLIVWHASQGTAQLAPAEAQYAQVLRGTGFEYLDSLLCATFRRNTDTASAKTAAEREIASILPPVVPENGSLQGSEISAHTPRLLYVECVPQDLAKLDQVRPLLESKGIHLKAPLFQGDESLRKRLNEEFLRRCDGVVVYFGSRNDLEAFVACQSLWDALQKYNLHLPLAVLLDPPDDPVRSFFYYPEFDNYPSTQFERFVDHALEGKP